MRHPESEHDALLLYQTSDAMPKDLLRCSSGHQIIQAVMDSPTVQQSRSFGIAETLSKHFAVRVARLQDGASWG